MSNRFENIKTQLVDDQNHNQIQLQLESGATLIAAERAQPAFSVSELTDYLNGGREMTLIRETMALEFERDPTFQMEKYYDLSKSQIRELVMTRVMNVAKFVETEPLDKFIDRILIMVLIDPGFATRLFVHFGLALSTILGQGTSEQVAFWKSKGATTIKKFYACFGMTELGHGSNVAGIETTATFDKANDQFIIHTPALSATKWWIGGAAESATHCIVFANLVVDKVHYGVKPFVVPLRDPETFALLPGINIGDCGAKFGRNAIDNGWIQFTFVAIPRSYMLMRFTKVDRDGKVTEPPNAQIAYGALIHGRTSIIRETCEYVKKAITIATRYAVVRKQGGNGPSKDSTGNANVETTIMDYKIHKLKLIPIMASAYALAFIGESIAVRYRQLMEELGKLDGSGTATNYKSIMDTLKDMHGTTSGLKALCTWLGLSMIETCRQSLGGQGYSVYAGIGPLYQDFSVHLTWEGDNSVMTLQAGRYLLGCLKQLQRGKKLSGDVSYLNDLSTLVDAKYDECSDLADPYILLKAFESVSTRCIVEAGKVYTDARKLANMDEFAALEACAAQRFMAAKMHCLAIIIRCFLERVENAPNQLVPIIKQLYGVFATSQIIENAGIFLQYGKYFEPMHLKGIGKKMDELIESLRPQVIPLTDAFNLSDYLLNSTLGCYDGNAYQRIFDRACQNNPSRQEHPYFERVIKPVLFRKGVDNAQLPLD